MGAEEVPYAKDAKNVIGGILMNGTQHKVVGMGFGIAGAYIATAGLNEPTGALIAATSIVGCMLPDIDHDNSKIGRKRKFVTELSTKVLNALIMVGVVGGLVLAFLIFKGFVDFGVNVTQLLIGIVGLIVIGVLKKIVGSSDVFKWATKHRGLMHTLAVPACFFFVIRSTQYPVFYWGTWGLLIGYLSHLFADMCTIEGCPILFPLTRKNIKLPTHLRTKDKKCTTAAYIIFVLAVAAGVGISKII